MYDEDEVKAALSFREHKAAYDKVMEDESDLLSTIKFTTYKREFTKSATRHYRGVILDALNNNGIKFQMPVMSSDGQWHFTLPELGDSDGD